MISKMKCFLYVSNKLIGLSLKRMDMDEVLQNDKSEIYSEEKYGPASVAYWTPIKRVFYEITVVCLSFTNLLGQVNILWGSCKLVCFVFFHELTLF